MGLDLMELFEALSIDLEGVRAVILTGHGDKAFCAGGDLKERNGMSDESWQAQHAIFERMVRAMMGCPIPLIAAVNGAAYGGGCEIAAASDFVYAATSARFALTEVTLGIMPGTGGRKIWHAVGERRARDHPIRATLHGRRRGWQSRRRAARSCWATKRRSPAHRANGLWSARTGEAIHPDCRCEVWDSLAFEIEA
jgi:enoyl-CoA hydratase/carnithine racemase